MDITGPHSLAIKAKKQIQELIDYMNLVKKYNQIVFYERFNCFHYLWIHDREQYHSEVSLCRDLQKSHSTITSQSHDVLKENVRESHKNIGPTLNMCSVYVHSTVTYYELLNATTTCLHV